MTASSSGMQERAQEEGNGMTARTGWEPWIGVAIALRLDGMEQSDLAQKLGWPESKVSRTVNGRRRIYVDELLKIAEVQDRPITWYLEGPNGGKGVYLSSFSHSLTQPLVAA